MTASEIYDHFRINRGLRQHMLRVAAVAKVIGEERGSGVAIAKVVSAALVHDLGNIVKTNFEVGEELFKPEGVAYWQEVKKEIVATYGDRDAVATKRMQQELELPEDIIDITAATGLRNIPAVAQHGTAEQKLMMYADLRVGINGVVSLTERFDDIHVRYVPRAYSDEMVAEGRKIMSALEAEMFSGLKLRPADITDQAIAPTMEELPKWSLKTNCA